MMGSNYGTEDSQIQNSKKKHWSSGETIVTLPWIGKVDLTRQSGVTTQVFIVKKFGEPEEIGAPSHSVVGSKYKNRKSNQQNIYHGINSILNQFLSGERRSLPGKQKLHAEAIWIATNFNELINASRDQDNSKPGKNIVEGVSAILEDHIAVYTSSSMCSNCSALFEDFYQHLREKENTKLPIFFFAKKGYNNGDREYGVWTIENGVYTSLPLSWSEEGKVYYIESLVESRLVGVINNTENQTLVTPGIPGGYVSSNLGSQMAVSHQCVRHVPHNVTSTENTNNTSISTLGLFNQNTTTAVDRNRQDSCCSVGVIANTSRMRP